MIETLKDRAVELMSGLTDEADGMDTAEALRVVQQATRLIEAVGVKRTEVRHVHVDEAGSLSPA